MTVASAGSSTRCRHSVRRLDRPRPMDFVNLPLFAAATLVFASVLTGLFSTRIGFSFLLVFLFAGIMAGEDGIGGYRFDDFRLSFWVGNLALAVILLDGGLRTAFATFRTGLQAGLGAGQCRRRDQRRHHRAGRHAVRRARPLDRAAARRRGRLHRCRSGVRVADTFRRHAERTRRGNAGDRVRRQRSDGGVPDAGLHHGDLPVAPRHPAPSRRPC